MLLGQTLVALLLGVALGFGLCAWIYGARLARLTEQWRRER